MFKRFASYVAGAAGAVAAAVPAMAESIIDVSTLEPDTSMLGVLGLAVCTGLLGIWGIRKVIKLVNRS